MRGAYTLGWRYLKERRGRSILTGGGIAIGVALVFGVLVANESTAHTFDQLIASISGSADVVITPLGAPDALLSGAQAKRIERLPDVRLAVPSVALETQVVRPQPKAGERLVYWVEGVDLGQDSKLRSWEVVAGHLPRPNANEIAVSRGESFGSIGTAKLGDVFVVATPAGPTPLRVSALVTNAGVGGRSASGSLTVEGRLITSVQEAQGLARAPGRYNTLSLVLRPGVSPDDWVARHRNALSGVDARTTTAAQKNFRYLLNEFLAALVWVASISLFISGFLIYLTLNRALLERASTFGLMRAVGASRRQVRAAVIAEAVTLGVIFTAIGLALGLVVAQAVTRLLAAVGFPHVRVIVRAAPLVTGVVVGIGTTVFSALLPARRVGKIQPGQAIRGLPAENRIGRAWIVGAVSVALGVVVALVPAAARVTALTYLVTVAVLLGCVLLVPPVLRPLASVLGRVTSRIARGTGGVSVRHLVRERSRSAYTLGLLMVVLAGLFTFGSIDASLGRAVNQVFDAQFGRPDALVRSDLAVLPSALEARIRREPGIDGATAVRFATTSLVGTRWSLTAMVIDPAGYFEMARYTFAAGDESSAQRGLQRGDVLLSEAIANAERIHPGDHVTIATRDGPRRFVVAGVIKTLPGLDAVFGLQTARTYLNSRDAHWILVKFGRGTDPSSELRSLNRLAGPYGASVVSINSFRRQFTEVGLRQLVRVFLVILLIAAFIGLLGLANTLAMSVADRSREIAIMRATGAARGAVRRMIVAESATLGAAAFILAVPLGWLLAALVTRGSSVAGLPLELSFPATWVPILCAIAVVVAVLAALVPAAQASRVRPAEALRFE